MRADLVDGKKIRDDDSSGIGYGANHAQENTDFPHGIFSSTFEI